MKPATKIVIFVVVAFIIVIIITALRRPATDSAVTASPTPVASVATDRSKTYTLADVIKHKVATDCWTAVGGNVYDLTPFVSKHPGGVENITKVCGIDGTAAFTQMHGTSQNAQAALATLKIGVLTQ